MSRLPHRRPRPTPFVDPDTRRRLRQLELAERQLEWIRTRAPMVMGRS